MFRKLIAVSISISLVIGNSAYVAADTSAIEDNTPSADAVMRRLDAFASLISSARAEIDRSQFDVVALVEDLGFDAETAIEFVKKEICFQQYPGALRGATGTLVGRAGNALDQALLLARLLKDSGYDARIARGTLDRSAAKALVNGIQVCDLGKNALGDTEDMAELLAEYSEKILGKELTVESLVEDSLSQESEAVELGERSSIQAAHVLDALKLAGSGFPIDTSIDAIVAEAGDYFWVQYKSGPSQGWTDVYLGFGDSDHLALAVVPTEYYVDEIPSALVHKIGLTISIERRVGDDVTRVPVSDQLTVPVAQLLGNPISLSFASLSGARRVAGIQEESSSRNEIFVPVIDGRPGRLAFDQMGNVVPKSEAATAFAGVFATAGSKLNIAGGALQQLGSTSDSDLEKPQTGLSQLENVVLEIEVINPGSGTQLHTRHLAPTSGNSEMDSAWSRILDRKYTLGASGGGLSAGFVLDNHLSSIEARMTLIRYAYLYPFGQQAVQDLTSRIVDETEAGWIFHPLLYSVFDHAPFYDPAEVVYRHEPSIVIHRVGYVAGDTIEEAIDIVTNSRRAFRRSESSLVVAPEVALAQGIWDTVGESAFFERPDGDMHSAFSQLEKADVDDLEVVVYRPDDIDKVRKLDISSHYQRVLQDHLGRGDIVVAHLDREVAKRIKPAFWRIDSRTGSALGIVDTGEGVAVTQRLVIGTIAFLSALAGCLIGGGDAYLCLTVAGIAGSATFGVIGPSLKLSFGWWPVTMAWISGVALILKELGW